MSVTDKELSASFSLIGVNGVKTEVVKLCLVLCQRYSLTAADLVNHWESFAVNNHGSKLNVAVLPDFEAEISRTVSSASSVSARNASPSKAIVTPRSADRRTVSKITANDLRSPSSTGNKRSSASFASPSTSATKMQKVGAASFLSPTSVQSPPDTSAIYATRSNAGHKTVEYNPVLGLRRTAPVPHHRLATQCKIRVDSSVGAPAKYRYMYTPLEERAAALEAGLLRLQEEMVAKYGLGELTPVGVPRQEEVVVVGRVCCETSEGKINRASIILEGSRRDSGGQRVHLDVKELTSFAFFPGQVVAVRGVNSSGSRMMVRGIIEGVPHPLPASTPSQLEQLQHGAEEGGGQPLSLLVAAGPFSTTDSLAYEPLNDLLGVVKAKQPDVVILVGPFVDAMHPKVASGDASVECMDGRSEAVDFETLFKLRISDKLDTLFVDGPSLPTHFIIIPSLRDVFHEYVYPQPPFHDRVEGGVELGVGAYPEERLFVLDIPRTGGSAARKRVHLAPNPALIQINGITLGVTSNDVLLDISGDEVSARAGNRLARLTEHLIQQQSFYPIFPPPAVGISGVGAQLDLRHAARWSMPVTPDMLLLPSRLAQFSREVQGCLCINPGQLSKGTGGGTFAEVAVHPMPKEALAKAQSDLMGTAGATIPHGLAARTCVEVRRI